MKKMKKVADGGTVEANVSQFEKLDVDKVFYRLKNNALSVKFNEYLREIYPELERDGIVVIIADDQAIALNGLVEEDFVCSGRLYIGVHGSIPDDCDNECCPHLKRLTSQMNLIVHSYSRDSQLYHDFEWRRTPVGFYRELRINDRAVMICTKDSLCF